ncbi:MAG: molybdopterin-synthase adenylyltransferase MoeB [Myxococcota bacterium]
MPPHKPLSPNQKARYARHLTLAEVGEVGQTRLRDGSVIVIGAGGLGSPCLLYLAAAGVGRIAVVDDDRVEASNLQRQVLHDTAAVGSPKAQSAAQRLRALNPHVEVVPHPIRLTPDNALDLLAPYDVVVDGTDNFASRYLINDACELLGKPLVYGAIQRFEGQVSVFNHRGGPTYRDLFPTPPAPEFAPNCAAAGVLGVLPGIIGTLQATEVIKLLLGRDDVLSGRLTLYDALAARFDELQLVRDPQRPPVSDLQAVTTMCAAPPWTDLSAADVRHRLHNGWRPWIVDVRRPEEAAQGGLPHTSTLIAHDQIAQHLATFPGEGPILVYCQSGGRSAAAARVLVDGGVPAERLHNLAGGWLGWTADSEETADP